MKGLPLENRKTDGHRSSRPVAGRARVGRAGDLCAPHGARHIRAPGKAQCRARFARDGVGPAAARAKLLVIARLRRTRGERQAANESAADPGRADRATVKLKVTAKPRSGENEAQARSFRWRSAVVLGLVVAGGAGLAARAVELQLLDHGFLAKQGDERSLRG